MANKNIVKALESIDTNELLKMPMGKFIKNIVDEKKLFHSERDMKLFILEQMDKVYTDGSYEWPIRYYTKDEELESVEEEMLTDDFVQTQLNGVPTK